MLHLVYHRVVPLVLFFSSDMLTIFQIQQKANCTVALFADDSKCYRAIQSQADTGLIQHDLESVAKMVAVLATQI